MCSTLNAKRCHGKCNVSFVISGVRHVTFGVCDVTSFMICHSWRVMCPAVIRDSVWLSFTLRIFLFFLCGYLSAACLPSPTPAFTVLSDQSRFPKIRPPGMLQGHSNPSLFLFSPRSLSFFLCSCLCPQREYNFSLCCSVRQIFSSFITCLFFLLQITITQKSSTCSC